MNTEYSPLTHSYYSYDVVGQSIMDKNDTLKTNNDKKILEFMKELNKEKLIKKEKRRRFSI